MATTTTTTTTPTKSGKGLSDGVVNELAAFFGVKPGHEEELRAAVQRFAQTLRSSDPRDTIRTGLRDSRHVIFDNGRRLLWVTTFETDWDPYLEDALIVVGPEPFLDWMQHTTQADELLAWYHEAGAAGAFDRSAPDFEQRARTSSAGLKAIIQSVQVTAAAYFNPLGAVTMPQISKAGRLNEAFQTVLDDPRTEQALRDPNLEPLRETLKPLLDLAAEG
jgi:hypothetical protein